MMRARYLITMLFAWVTACGGDKSPILSTGSNLYLTALGRQLFFEPRLSADRSMSCQSCHDPKLAFADPRPLSQGVTGIHLARNSPSVLYVKDLTKFTWANPVLDSLEEQILVPLFSENPPEQHIGPREEEIYNEIFKNEPYKSLKERAGSELNRSVSTRALVVAALASYLRSLSPFESPYDRFRTGNAAALTEQQRQGLVLFEGKADCTSCHGGPLFNGQLQQEDGSLSPNIFRKNGLNDRARRPEEALGMAEFTLTEEDWNLFRVPSLRNVARTAPYLHDGSRPNLRQVIVEYNEKHALLLSDEEMANLLHFLEALSDPIHTL